MVSEHQEQCSLITWTAYASVTYPELDLLFAIPNGGKRQRVIAAKLKAEGVKSGVPDLMLPVARGNYHGLFVEMKRKDGKESPNQKVWRERLIAENYQAIVCHSWLEAKDAIIFYLNLQPHLIERLIHQTLMIGIDGDKLIARCSDE